VPAGLVGTIPPVFESFNPIYSKPLSLSDTANAGGSDTLLVCLKHQTNGSTRLFPQAELVLGFGRFREPPHQSFCTT
jgi:hypothetical protein